MDQLNQFKIIQDYEDLLDYQKSMLFTITCIFIQCKYVHEQEVGIKGGFRQQSNMNLVNGITYALQYKSYAFFNAIVKQCKAKSKPLKIHPIIIEHCLISGPPLLRLLKNASFYNVLMTAFDMYESDPVYIQLIIAGLEEQFITLYESLNTYNTHEIMKQTKHMTDEKFDELYNYFYFVIS